MKKVVVIGAGISGLAAAIYAQRSGFNVTICEQHSIAGGMCTSWKRKGYLFEGAIHWLTGSSSQFKDLNQIWRETGALNDNVPIIYHQTFRSIEWEGQIIHLYRDIDKTAEQLLAISPKDERQIKQLVKDVKILSKITVPVFDVKGVKTENPHRMSLGFILKMLQVLPVMLKMMRLSSGEYIARFAHPGIRQLLRRTIDEYTAYASIGTFAIQYTGDGGYPEGGSLPMVSRMVKTFTELGGKLLLNTKVQKINIYDGAATGVKLKTGMLDADAVIITQETIAAMEKLFDTPPQDEWLKKIRRDTEPELCTFIGIGIRIKLPGNNLPEWKLETPITYAGQTVTHLGFYNYCEYEGYAPDGCTVLTAILSKDTYDFWKQAKADGRYEAEKQSLAEQVSHALCQKYPQCEGKIEVIDIATPLTYERYTGAYKGSWMATFRTSKNAGKRYPGFCKDVKGLYFAGHRLMPPGGLPFALISGRVAAQMVCRDNNVIFKGNIK